jgi:hypothetical protein
VAIECPVGPLAAQGFWVNWLQVVTEAQPWVEPTGDGSGYRPDTSYLSVRQVPPYTYEIADDPESDIRITRA